MLAASVATNVWQFLGSRTSIPVAAEGIISVREPLLSVGAYVRGKSGGEYRVMSLDNGPLENDLRRLVNRSRFELTGTLAAKGAGQADFSSLHFVWLDAGIPKVLKVVDGWAIGGAGEAYVATDAGAMEAIEERLNQEHFFPPLAPSDLFDAPASPPHSTTKDQNN